VTRKGYVRLAIVTLVVTVVVIIWGAVVRATGSGAGCGSHWPLCNGTVVPLEPGTKTIIEFTHRLTSGVAMLLSLGLMLASWRVFPRGHRARVWAAAAFVFMLIEAAIGAGLVLLGLVEDNASVARAVYIAAHLTNTMLLLGAVTGALWWAKQDARDMRVVRSRGLAAILIFLIVVAATGAVVALGDTLFPHETLAEGLRADVDPASHVLIRLRWIHPALAATATLVILALTRRDATFTSRAGASLGGLVVALVMAQVALGVLTLILLAPLPLQMAHLLGSNLLWIALVWAWVRGTQPPTDN
jgi:heme A synthase